MKRYWINELAIIEIDDFNFDYDKPQWKKVYLADEVDAETMRLRNALGRIMEVDAGSLIGSHYRDTIIDIAREALAEKGGECTPTQT